MILHGDCLNEMRAMEDNSVDSVVTDPPYGISFMNKKWDYDVPKVEVWQEAMRALKPGGHILVACGTRTQHRMAVNIEDAGFEIRDIVAWVYGSGFPKSLNIGKAVDKLQGNEREFVSENPANRPYNLTKGETSTGWKSPPRPDKTKGTSEWEGWGTALKPAMELWTLARKPLSEKTVAENCLKWGTGGINIDESRVDVADSEKESFAKEWDREQSDKQSDRATYLAPKESKKNLNEFRPTGRFPANLIHDNSEEVRECFPENNVKGSAIRKNKANPYGGERTWSVSDTPAQDTVGYADSGNASRFFKSIFYCPKASKAERNKGCEGLEEKSSPNNLCSGSVQKSGEGTRLDGKPLARNTNNHPTVKPIALMEYLITMVTPKGGTVLDPYMGSGTTGIACKKEGFEFIGIELDEDYFKIAKARIEKLEHQHELF